MLDFPVTTLVRFWANHHLLDIFGRPCWRVVSGRGKQYVDKILAGARAGQATSRASFVEGQAQRRGRQRLAGAAAVCRVPGQQLLPAVLHRSFVHRPRSPLAWCLAANVQCCQTCARGPR